MPLYSFQFQPNVRFVFIVGLFFYLYVSFYFSCWSPILYLGCTLLILVVTLKPPIYGIFETDPPSDSSSRGFGLPFARRQGGCEPIYLTVGTTPPGQLCNSSLVTQPIGQPDKNLIFIIAYWFIPTVLYLGKCVS